MKINLKYIYLLILIFIINNVDAQVANFSADQYNGCKPLVVEFTDLSTGGITSWDWSFGNGNSSISPGPVIATYHNPGIYPVRLTVTDGATSDTYWDTIVVYEDPVVDFVADVTSGCSNLEVFFTNTTVTGTGVASSIWNFGGAGSSNNNDTVTQVFHSGVFTVNLIVTDSAGCIGQGEKIAYINSIEPPVPSFISINSENCFAPSTVDFTNTSTSSVGATYTWHFGDGFSSTLPSPSHPYTSYGSYDVKLIVDKNGCVDSITRTNFVVLDAQDADFSVDATNICIGNAANFTDQSTLLADSWYWDFGDGIGTSTIQNPQYTYPSVGTYTVTMTAFKVGCDDIEVKNTYITVNSLPNASFVADETDTCTIPFLVNFTSIATAGVTYHWDFDGSASDTSNLANPSHEFTEAGFFNVNLVVTDVNGCKRTVDSLSYIHISPPIANFAMDTAYGCAPRIVNFDNLSISNNTIVSYFWDFDDGLGFVSGPEDTTFTFVDTGTFNIGVIIIDNFGCTDTIDKEVQIGRRLYPNFSVNLSPSCRKDTLEFTNLTNTTTIDTASWQWQFGDGGQSELFEPTYEYNDTGYFNITLLAEHNGCTSDTTIDSLVKIFSPIARFNTDFDCIDQFNVEFMDNSIEPDLWTWTIDGSTFSSDTLTYSFIDTGSYIIKLVVENTTHSCIDSIEQTIQIVNPSVDFSYSDSIGCPPFLVNFSDSSIDALGWLWDFGDGTPIVNSQNPSHTYNNGGIFDVTLVILSLNGCQDTLVKPQVIKVFDSQPDFTVNDTSGCRDFEVIFSNLSSTTGGPITSVSWAFGDGTTSTDVSPTHLYTDVGSFNVTLEITDSAGCVNQLTKTNYITSTGPTPSFNNTLITCKNDTAFFNSTSISLGGNVDTWLWNFGDGFTSPDENPYHIYDHSANYNVSLQITDDNGCDSTLTINNAIYIDSLFVDFIADSNVGSCTGFIVQFNQLVSPNPISWEWDFGPGNGSSQLPNPNVVFNTVGDFDIELIAENSSGCRDSLTIPNFITVEGPIGVLSQSVTSGCLDLDVEFCVVTTNSVSNVWDFGDGIVPINNLACMTHTYTAEDTIYPSVILEDAAGCQVSYFFDSIMVGSLEAIMDIDTNYVCTPGIVNFSDISNSTPPINSWLWDFGFGYSSSTNTPNPGYQYTTPGVFDINMIVNNGFCSDTASVTQYIVSDSSTLAQFSITPPAIVCPPTFVQFSEFSTSDSTIIGWQWDFGNGITSNIQNATNIQYDTAGTFLVTLDIITEKGCISHFQDVVVIDPIPLFNFNLDSIGICIGEDTTINSLGDATFTWTPAINLTCSDCPDPTFYGENSQTYFVNAVNEYGCEFDDTVTFVVHGLPPILVSEDEAVLIGDTVQMHAFTTATNIDWSPRENLSCNNCPDNTYIAQETQDFIISISDDFGCENSDTIHIDVFDLCDGSSIFLPNIFTPNNDRKNDVFKAAVKAKLIPNIHYYRIFDRWGNLVFEANSILDAWDGNDKNGIELNNGVYIYMLDIACLDGSDLLLQGNVTLIR